MQITIKNKSRYFLVLLCTTSAFLILLHMLNVGEQASAQGQQISNLSNSAASNITLDSGSISDRLPEEFSSNFETVREIYLNAWNNAEFKSSFDTFIKPGSAKGYGIYQKHPSNIFKPGDTIELYVEPVGFAHKTSFDERGDVLYLFNFTANVVVFDKEGNQIHSTVYETPQTVSHNKITEHYLSIPLNQDTPLDEGEYIVNYFIDDGASGQTFELQKPIRVAEIVSIS